MFAILTKFPSLAQLVRASSLYLEGPTFESWRTDNKKRTYQNDRPFNNCKHYFTLLYSRFLMFRRMRKVE